MTTVAAAPRAARSSARWPSCSAPIVGTSATSSRPASAAVRSGSVRATTARVRDGEWIGICRAVPLRWMESVPAVYLRGYAFGDADLRVRMPLLRAPLRGARLQPRHARRLSRSAPPARSRSCSRRSRRAPSAATSLHRVPSRAAAAVVAAAAAAAAVTEPRGALCPPISPASGRTARTARSRPRVPWSSRVRGRCPPS